MAALFDAKHFNEVAFGKYMNSIPDARRNKLLESGAIVRDKRLSDTFAGQTTTAYAEIPFYGNLEGTPDNYDGATDITTDSTKTYLQGCFTYGRAHGWTEKDFSYDITGGVDFMANVRNKILKYWNDVDQDVLLAILKGVFLMTGSKNTEFVTAHTNDITSIEGDGVVDATTLNNTIQKACGDNKDVFKLAIMHSAVATNLENLKLLGYLKYTDANGVERDLGLATWNGRIVIIDDSMPTENVAAKTGENVSPAYTKYTTYILGEAAFSLEPMPVKVPYEMVREAKINGGQDTLISRKRNGVSVYGISYLKKNQASLSPTNDELAKGTNWGLVADSDGDTIAHKLVPIARIISKG